MTAVRALTRWAALLGVALLSSLCGQAGPLAAPAAGEEPSWRLEQPRPPRLANGTEPTVPIGLGKIGDIEFWAPNRGLLITAGNPPSIPPGVWTYDGREWRELASVCGATDGRVVWAGPDEFWTISDGRPGQAVGETAPPLADNTLCHFQAPASEKGEVAASFGSLAFRPDSYQAMHAGGCIAPNDCWFAGDPLPQGQVGAFHLHWDGSSLGEVPNPQGHAVEDMRLFGERLYESVRLLPEDHVTEPEPPFEPFVVHLIRPAESGEPPFLSLKTGVPTYAPGEFPSALDFLHLSAGEESLWGAANPVERPPAGSAAGEVSIVRDAGGVWSQIFGPGSDPVSGNPFTKFLSTKKPGEENQEEIEAERTNEVVDSVAAEPSGSGAWVALTSRANRALGSLAPAMVARVHTDQTVSDRQTLPTALEGAEGVGPKGAADKVVCPAVNDCWLATAQGWLFHLAEEGNRTLPANGDPAFAGLITFRPADAGVPAVVPDAPPVDDSGLLGEPPPPPPPLETPAETEPKVSVALVSRIRERFVHGTTLEVRFHLAAKARVRLLAKRRRSVVASTPRRTLGAGNHMLALKLDRRRWPTKLDLQAHALGKLPTVGLRGSSNTSVGTALHVLPRTPSGLVWGPQP
jgi:hypothetical protein